MKAKTWQLRFRHFPELGNVEVLHASNVTHDYPPHIHEQYSIAIVLRGVETTFCNETSYTARRGDIIIIRPEVVHSNTSVSSEYKLIKVPVETMDRIADELYGASREPLSFPNVVVKDSLLFRKLVQFHLKLDQGVSVLEQHSLFLSCMNLLLQREHQNLDAVSPNTKNEREYVREVREYLKAHYAENVTLSDLTSLTKLSPFHLLRAFRKSAGFPPHEYQTQVRIAHARKLIRDGVPLSQAALDTGFFDQSHLCRNFKRIVGVTPRQYCDNKNSLN